MERKCGRSENPLAPEVVSLGRFEPERIPLCAAGDQVQVVGGTADGTASWRPVLDAPHVRPL